MANIIINNKQYNNVPSVTFDKVGGGTATYTEGGGGGGVTVEQLNVSAAGTYTAPTGTAYSPVVVPSGTEGTPTATKGTVISHSITVTPSVTNTGGYISGSTKTGTSVTVSASELVSGTKSITSAGTVDVANYASASVPSGSVVIDDVELDESDLYMSASVDSSGLVTYSVGYQGYTDATITSGYVSSYTSGGLEVTASGTLQLSTQAATTITPTTSSQTAVASGKYTTGAVTVNPIPSQYIVPSGTISITSNGTIDVTQYASASVNVSSPSLTNMIANGDFSISGATTDGWSSVNPTRSTIAVTDGKLVLTHTATSNGSYGLSYSVSTTADHIYLFKFKVARTIGGADADAAIIQLFLGTEVVSCYRSLSQGSIVESYASFKPSSSESTLRFTFGGNIGTAAENDSMMELYYVQMYDITSIAPN